MRAGVQIETIQLLRFVAALLVALYHLSGSVPETELSGSVLYAFQGGGLGVDIFFVISGFIMVYTTRGARSFDATTFLWSRLLRIFPPYWVVLGATMLIATLAMVAFDAGGGLVELMTPTGLFVSVTLLPAPHHVMAVAWTLALEIVFYIVFALAFAAARLRGVVVALLLWYAAAVVYREGFFAENPDYWILLHSIVIEFLYGVLIGYAFIKGKLRFGPAVFALGTLLCCLYLWMAASDMSILPREFERGIPAALLVYGAAATKWAMPRAAVVGGESSYVLYLIHSLFYGVVFTLAGMAGINLGSHDALLCAVALGAVLLSVLLTILLERPYEAWRRRFVSGLSAGRRKPTRPASAPVSSARLPRSVRKS